MRHLKIKWVDQIVIAVLRPGRHALKSECFLENFAMKSWLLLMMSAFVAMVAESRVFADEQPEMAELWSCSGYCFMGGDTPTNPWIPVSATGSSEQEARDKIDWGQFIEVDITCRKVQYRRN